MKQSILPGAAALLMTIAVGARADSIYYTLDATTKGLKFTAEASRYQGKYEAIDFKYTIKSPRDTVTGLASGKRQHGAITLTRLVGESSPQLFAAVAANDVIKTVTIDFLRPDSRGLETGSVKVVIFGASGATGLHLVDLALDLGHTVTAFVRESRRLTKQHAALRVAVGDAMAAPDVDAAMAGQEAVLCALGNMPDRKADRDRQQPEVPVCSAGTANIIAAMEKHGVRRIVAETATSVGSSRRTGRFGIASIGRIALRDVMNDKEIQERHLMDSRLDWTIVRPVRLSDAPAVGRIESGDDLDWAPWSKVTRADVAAFMLAALTDKAALRRAITVRN